MTINYLHHTQGTRGYKYQKTERTTNAEIDYLHSKATRLSVERNVHCPNRDAPLLFLKKHCNILLQQCLDSSGK